MKWIKVVDPAREVPGGNKMRKFLYDEIRRLASQNEGVVENVGYDKPHYDEPENSLSGRLYLAVRDGRLKTKCDVWRYCLRYHMPWLKEHGFVVTDVPYKPRLKQRRTWGRANVGYSFVSSHAAISAKSKDISPAILRIVERYAGKLVTERRLWRELSAEQSPKGVRTMWRFFCETRRRLIYFRLLKIVDVEDPLILMHAEMDEV